VPDHLLDRPHRVLDPGLVDPEVIDGAADLVDVEGRLLELVVQALAEPDDRVVQRIGRLPVLAGADLVLTFNSDATRSNFCLMARWSSFMLPDSSKSQTTVSLCWAGA
jgi:hypothetical protein